MVSRPSLFVECAARRRGCVGMSTTKSFPARTLVSIFTGCGVPGVTFDQLHESIEHLIGEPVWTHQLGQRGVWDDARAEIIRQLPAFSADTASLKAAVDGLDGDEREAAAQNWLVQTCAAMGYTCESSIDVVKGGGTGRTDAEIGRDAMTSLLDIAGKRPVIAVVTG